MRKLREMLAIALSVLMLLLPLTAGAEGTGMADAVVLTASGLKVESDGETLADLKDLTLQSAIASNGEAMALFMDLINLNENIASVMLQLDQESMIGYLGGMSKTYGVNYASLEEMLGGMMLPAEGDLIGGADHADPSAMIAELTELLSSWELPGKLSELYTEKLGGIEFGEGELRENGLTYTGFSFDFMPLMNEQMELIAQDQLIGTLLSQYAGIEDLSALTQALEGMEYTMDGEIGTDETGARMDITVNYNMTVEGTPVVLTLRASSSLQDGVVDASLKCEGPESAALFEVDLNVVNSGDVFNARLDFIPGDEYEDKLAVSLTGSLTGAAGWLNGTVEKTDRWNECTVTPFNMNYVFGNSSAFNATISAKDKLYSFALTDTVAAMNAALTIVDDGDKTMIALDSDKLTGNGALSIESDGSLLRIGFAPAETAADGALLSGNLSLQMKSAYSDETISMDVSLSMTQMDLSAYHLDPLTMVDLLTISEDQSAEAMQELMTTVTEAAQKLEAAYDSLAGLSMLLGGGELGGMNTGF